MGFLSTLDCRVFVLEHLHDTLCTDCEVLLVKLFGVLGDGRDKVVWAEFGGADLSAVAVQELDGHVGAILCKEGNCLLTGFDRVAEMPHWRALRSDIVGGSKFGNLVAVFVLLLLDELLELLKSEVVLTLTLWLGLLFLAVLGVHDVVHFGAILVLHDLVAVHVVKNLATLAAHIVVHLGLAVVLLHLRVFWLSGYLGFLSLIA